jgi:hypothetical protein
MTTDTDYKIQRQPAAGPHDDVEVEDITTAEALLHEACQRAVGIQQGGWLATGVALGTIRDHRLYRADYGNFEAYVKARFRMSRRSAYRFIDAGQVYEELEEIATTNAVTKMDTPGRRWIPKVQMPDRLWREVTIPESALRPLVSIPHDERQPVLARLAQNLKIL